MEVKSLPREMSAPEVLRKLTAILNQQIHFQMAYMAFINFHINSIFAFNWLRKVKSWICQIILDEKNSYTDRIAFSEAQFGAII